MTRSGKKTFMKKILFTILMFIFPALLYAAMSDSKAATEAFKIWGVRSHIAAERTWGASNWTRKIGFLSPGCKDDFTVVGSGFNTWDAAFAALPADKGIGDTINGITPLRVDSPAPVSPVPVVSDVVPGLIVRVQILIDGSPIGPPLETGTGALPWSVQVQWDTTTVSDGPHILCAQVFHPDGSYGRMPAVMLMVKR